MKRLLFFPGHRLLAYEWEGRRYRRYEAFEPDSSGFEQFRAWLEEAPRLPVHMLIDVIEEEFHIEQVPHVIGRDRMDLMRRTAEKRFRSTPYRYITCQRRLKSGRRDDEMLVAGMTNPQLLQPWLDVIDSAGTPLRGIYSLPLVGQHLLRRLGFGKRPVLLVSQEVSSTARQSFYDNGRLRFSRLVPGRYEDAEGYGDFVEREIEQTIHYLGSQRLRRRQEPVDVVVLASSNDLDALRERLADGDGVTFHVFTLEEAARRIGLRGTLPGEYSDTLFGHALLNSWLPTNHYGLSTLRRHYFIQRARVGLAATAAGCVVAAAGVGGAAWLQVEANRAGTEQARDRARLFEQRYEARLAQLSEFDYRAVDVKDAVDLLDDIQHVRTVEPGGAMARLGNVLGAHPNVLLGRLDWRATRSDTVGSGDARGFGRGQPLLASGSGRNSGVHEHLLIRGDIVGFGGVYRTAIEYFEDFVDALRAHEEFDRVEVIQAPFDLEPETGVSGDSGLGARDQRASRAAFSVAVRLRAEVADAAQ